ncbi:hypothetical protein AMTR_s00113p00105950 [Amborella trichopoda]|uniref:Uncharacterized protein n=1 Tax=Amborella trichopoda TaxID=13333 RepID=W1NPE1_AMBTC|nr:hypothetical protein AMTR_s00113p00105950 [Amborella trichopoda]
MSTSYASDCKELLGISFEKIRGRHDSEIHIKKLRWEFTRVPHRAERMMGGRAPQFSVSVGRRPSHKGRPLWKRIVLGRVSRCMVSLVTLHPNVLLDHRGMQSELGATSSFLVMGAHFLMRIRCLLKRRLLMRSGESRREREDSGCP